MSLRPPRSVEAFQALVTGEASLQAEIMAEKATALGRAGEAVAKALSSLAEAGPDERTTLAYAAAEALQGLFIQRELMGLRGHAEVIRQLGVPPEVLAKVGARRPSSSPPSSD